MSALRWTLTIPKSLGTYLHTYDPRAFFGASLIVVVGIDEDRNLQIKALNGHPGTCTYQFPKCREWWAGPIEVEQPEMPLPSHWTKPMTSEEVALLRKWD